MGIMVRKFFRDYSSEVLTSDTFERKTKRSEVIEENRIYDFYCLMRRRLGVIVNETFFILTIT